MSERKAKGARARIVVGDRATATPLPGPAVDVAWFAAHPGVVWRVRRVLPYDRGLAEIAGQMLGEGREATQLLVLYHPSVEACMGRPLCLPPGADEEQIRAAAMIHLLRLFGPFWRELEGG